jgi:hypothetical protein
MDEDLVRHFLTAMPRELLLDEWRVSQRRLTAGSGDALWEVRVRELLIDELQTRDPVGTARWLSEAPASPPDHFIRPEPGLGG